MDRHAIFVDVGYMLASVAELVTGSPERRGVRCDFGDILERLVGNVADISALPLLRTYWYDASITGQPEYDQQTIATLQGVRLRLGRLVRGEQKGVDSRIVRDLIVLAWDKAIAEAYLLAGDEDLCEGVQEAQDHGVRVVLMGIPGLNQSPMLVQQVDAHHELSESFWRELFQPYQPPAAAGEVRPPSSAGQLHKPPSPAPSPAVQQAWQQAVDRGGSSPMAELAGNVASETGYFRALAEEAGRAAAEVFLESWGHYDLQELLSLSGWQVPPNQDRWLLRYADDHMQGVLWERPELKATVRTAFKEAAKDLVVSGGSGS